ncbi:hypothetical protein G9A89_002567 [Geosiphon pyriformis]|nr:hypothetical protein G9A89_002567 [Geosiphon pyriformis]
MISLLQLNQHLDDLHSDTSIDQKDGILNWFRNAQNTIGKQLSKAPLTRTKLTNISSNLSQTVISKLNELDVGMISDEQPDYVAKGHWQLPSENDFCTKSNCDKQLNLKNGKQNCRKCGKLFCDSHCHLQIKLNKLAKHDPVDGTWCRVCDDCFESRDGYLDIEGFTKSHTTAFAKARHKGMEKAHLEGNRLEKRLEKLAKLYATPAKPTNFSNTGLKPPLTTLKHRRRVSEQAIVKWEDDSSVTNCPICKTSFGKITNRKHHCRLCGRVICEKCSSKVSLNLHNNPDPVDQDPVGEVRVCRECRTAVFRRREYNEELSKPAQVVLLYQKLTKIRHAIDKTLPKFQDMLDMLQTKEIVNQTHADYQLATRTRKELLDNFAQFDFISKKINSLPHNNNSEKRLQSNIHLAANQYLQQNMLPLSMLPKILKNDPQQRKTQGPDEDEDDDEDSDSPDAILAAWTNGRPRSLSVSSSRSVKGEEKPRQQLAVLVEQQKQVQGFIQEATRKRKFDDVITLKASLDELQLEISKIKKELGDL